MTQTNSDFQAIALLHGSPDYPNLQGTVTFRQLQSGVRVIASVHNLPDEAEHNLPDRARHNSGFFAFHIHEGRSCSGNSDDPFANAGMHYNPANTPHPYHAGDLPPLLSNNGYAYMSVYTDRFTVNEIIGRTLVIHDGTDDFTTQPAGNAGAKIACGVICSLLTQNAHA